MWGKNRVGTKKRKMIYFLIDATLMAVTIPGLILKVSVRNKTYKLLRLKKQLNERWVAKNLRHSGEAQ